MRRFVRKAIRIVFWSILSLCIIVLTAYFLLKLPPVQQKIKVIALQEITKKTKNTVSIGNLKFSPFNRLQLEEVYASDLKNDTLFYAEKIYADFDFLKLLRKKFIIHSVEIDRFDLRISKDSSNAPYNFQFLIDAFASDKIQQADNSNLQLALEFFQLKNGRLRYDVFSETFQKPDLFDVNHINISNLHLNTKFKLSSADDWNGAIDNFSFDEKCGFALKEMKFRFKNLNNLLTVDRFYISLPTSVGEIPEASFDYTGLSINEIFSGSVYSILLSSGKWYPGDFSCLFPELAGFTETVTFAGEIKGTFPEIICPHLELYCGKQFQLLLNSSITDYKAWDTSTFILNVEKCLLDPEPFGFPIHTDLISITGTIDGSLPDFNLNISAKNKQANLLMKGTGRVKLSTGDVHFDLNCESSECNLKNLLSDSIFGNASFRFTTKGIITELKKIDASADFEIHRFDYRGYSYRDITANAVYRKDSVSVNLICNDPFAPFTLQGNAGLNQENAFVELQVKLAGVRPDVLNLLPQYSGSELSGNAHVIIKGLDPELMYASVVVDNLHWSTPAGDFKDSPITFTYLADANSQKQINFRSHTLTIRGKGNLTFEGVTQSVQQAFPAFAINNKLKNKNIPERENFDFLIGIRQANALIKILGMETTIPDSALFVGKYNREGKNLNLNVTVHGIFMQSDTTRIEMDLSNIQNNLAIQMNVQNKSNQYNFEGNIGATVDFIPNPSKIKPGMKIALTPGLFILNGTAFQIRPAQIDISNNRYEIDNFALRHKRGEYIKVSGIISDNAEDSLQISVNQFEIRTILSALKNKIPLSGTASGEITLSRLTSNPLILTRNLVIDSLVFDGNEIGNLKLRSGWSSERQGLALRATWSHPDANESVISGFVLPKRDSLSLTAEMQGIRLKWINGYLPDMFYGLEGELSAQLKANGSISDPVLSGTLHFNNATVGIPVLNTRYRMTDSVFLEKDRIVFRNCIVNDETNRNMKINGNISHKQFSSLDPRLTLDFNRFLVLNNKEQIDSLFYGLIRVNGNLSVSLQNREWLIQGRLSNEKANKIMLNIPESATEAQQYNWLTFINTQKDDSSSNTIVKELPSSELSAFSLPLKFQITLAVNPDLSAGIIFNQDTKDAAVVKGNGILDLSYNTSDPVPRLLGNYIINDGNCTLSIINITRKTFSIQPGGKLNFQGDIMNTMFDLSAIYSLRTYLTNLDPSFAAIATASKNPVNCVLNITGKFDDMKLKYRIDLPNQPDEVQRKIDGLLYSDENKIKEIAYLLAFGTFSPVNSSSSNSENSSLWTSLASSSITAQLNNLLSGVLSDRWTIGTDLHSHDSNFSDVDMDVNISGSMFDDRLTINSTLGFHNTTNQINNFTGDFNVEYKLSPNGNLLLQFYNVTNNQYYDRSRAPLTQGTGIVYKKQSRTLRHLFK